MTYSAGFEMTDHDNSRPGNIYWIDDDDPNAPQQPDVVLSLAKVARMFGISRLRLLALEALGLIRRRYRVGAERVYGWADCERIVFIIKARRAGLTLRDIAPVLRATNCNLPESERRRGLARCLLLIDQLEKRRQPLDQATSELQHMCTLLTTELNADRRDRG
jgi:DNA-binding transcriptional MerR regulator